MQFLAELWLPIVVSSALVFVASSLLHMVLPLHKRDYRGLPHEGRVLDALRDPGLTPGEYFFPHAPGLKELGEPGMIAKFKQGPVGILTVRPSGPPNMGPALVQWFLYSLLTGVFTAYIATLGLGAASEYLTVFRVTGAVAFLGYGIAAIPNSIWMGKPWRTTAVNLFDGLVYALLTAGAFAWLW